MEESFHRETHDYLITPIQALGFGKRDPSSDYEIHLLSRRGPMKLGRTPGRSRLELHLWLSREWHHTISNT